MSRRGKAQKPPGARARNGRPARRPAAVKRGKAPRSSAAAKRPLDPRARALEEALAREAATAEVLRVIASSPGELQLVFETMLANAVRTCGAKFGVLWLSEGDGFRAVALHGAPPAFAQARRREPWIRTNPGTGLGRAAETRQPVQTADIRQEPAYLNDPQRFAVLDHARARTMLTVPMLKDNEMTGALGIYRQEVRPFTDKQIELVSSFASQAIIAIENARLLNELRQRTDDLTESLEQQTATSEVLRVISSSPGEVEPVFNAMLENATRICEANFGTLTLVEGDELRVAAMHGASRAFEELRRKDPRVPAAVHRLFATKQMVHMADIAAEKAFANSPLVKLAGARTFVGVPLLKDGELIGALTVYRQEVRPFTDRQLDLLPSFASQAVIAIENARLLNELRQRTADLGESLEQQTATSEVLRVISSSPGDLDPVFNSMLANATRLCGAKFGTLLLYDGEAYRAVAMHDVPPPFAEFRRRNAVFRPGSATSLGLMAKTRQVIQVPDIMADQAYLEGDLDRVALAQLGGFRAVVSVPMLKDDELIGGFNIFREQPGPFTDKQIQLVTNFANQAVIAIENTRLLNELRESLQQQTATADVLNVISSSPGELAPVFDSMLENATRICEANFGLLFLSDGDAFRTAAMHNAPAPLVEARRREELFRPPPHTALGRMVLSRQPTQIADMLAERDYFEAPPGYSRPQIALVAGARTVVAVPMLKDGALVGAIVIYRQEVRPFTDKQVELVKNFASQAVIAIENARLLNELRESLQQQTATADVLKVISSSPGNLG